MPLDTSVFDKVKGFQDYQRADEEFQMRKQAAQLDNHAKQLSLVGQVVGNSSTDQDSYDRARAYAQNLGVDTSFLPDQYDPNVINRLRFAGATPTSQLSAMLQQQQMALRAGTATGDVGAFGYGAPQTSGSQLTNNQVLSPKSSPPLKSASMSQGDQNKAVNDIFGGDNAASPVILSTDSPQPSPANKFSPPPQNPGETITAYKNRVDTAFNAFKSDPNYIADSKKAEKTGEFTAANEEGAKVQSETLKRLDENLNALKMLNDNLPEYGGIAPVGVKARLGLIGGNALGDGGKGYDALQKWDEINQQQVVNAIGDLVKGGQIRGNQFIEKIINRGYAVDPNAQKNTRADQIEILRNELKNAAAQAKNIAGGNADYTPTLPNQNPKPGTTMQGTDGNYMYNGGDPAQSSNWKKVK